MTEHKDLLKRIESLNNGPLTNRPDPCAEVDEIRRKVKKQKGKDQPAPNIDPILYRRDLPRPEERPVIPPVQSGSMVILEEAVEGVEICGPHGGKAYLIETRLSDHKGKLPKVSDAFVKEFESRESKLIKRISAVCDTDGLCPRDLIVMDLETTGLSNSPVFLVGILVWEDDGLVVKQFLARDYSEEIAITSLFTQSMLDKKLLVTFNGKTFDFPYMRVRAAANGVPFIPEPPHLDMLHECRRIYRGVLPNCKLQTLEKHVCGTTRYGDIPGHEIPNAYHAYVRTSNAEQIVKILRHNALDLITLVDLMTRLP
ncbi:MAG: ribonuclease H-like domain-containing protein [Armatimonadota bacterium]